MRPRVFPAEDLRLAGSCSRPSVRFNEAAGIPRGRRDPAWRTGPGAGRFNEAAGIPRGRLDRSLLVDRPARASMRPRVFPAEDVVNAL